jgi:TRAP-type C4-dicarboxylate transport system permease small subunit
LFRAHALIYKPFTSLPFRGGKTHFWETVMVEKSPKPKTDIKAEAVDLVTVILFLCMVIAALMQVLFRFVLKLSVPWTEELARILYVWIVFLGAVLVEADNNQIKTTFIIDKFPPNIRFIIQVCINVFCILFEICLTLGALIMFQQARTMNFGTMPFLATSILYVPVILSCPLVIWYLVRQLISYGGPPGGASGEAGEKVNTREPLGGGETK